MNSQTIYMQDAMKILVDACKIHDDWRDCWSCPFADYCEVLVKKGKGYPFEWKIGDKNENDN